MMRNFLTIFTLFTAVTILAISAASIEPLLAKRQGEVEIFTKTNGDIDKQHSPLY